MNDHHPTPESPEPEPCPEGCGQLIVILQRLGRQQAFEEVDIDSTGEPVYKIHRHNGDGPTEQRRYDLRDRPCPECGFEGPHAYWPEDQEAECSDCGIEFKVVDP